MKWFGESNTLELTARNVAALLAKLDDPHSARMLVSGDGAAAVFAVETVEQNKVAASAAERVVTLSRAQLAQLSVEGASVTASDITVTSVADAAHYRNRPSGIVLSPSTGDISAPDITHWRFHHICEVCGIDKILTSAEAFDAGWDYPPRVGTFGVIGPRTCPGCLMTKSVWWAIAMEGYTSDMLSDHQREVVARILSEPGSIAVDND